MKSTDLEWTQIDEFVHVTTIINGTNRVLLTLSRHALDEQWRLGVWNNTASERSYIIGTTNLECAKRSYRMHYEVDMVNYVSMINAL